MKLQFMLLGAALAAGVGESEANVGQKNAETRALMLASCTALFQVAHEEAEQNNPMLAPRLSDLTKISAARFVEAAKAANMSGSDIDELIEQAVNKISAESGPHRAKIGDVLAAREPACAGLMGFGDVNADRRPARFAAVNESSKTKGMKTVWAEWPSGASLVVDVPIGWDAEFRSPGGGIPQALAIEPRNIPLIKLLITPFVPSKDSPRKENEIAKFVKEMNVDNIAASTERGCKIVAFNGPTGLGAYCRTTDATLVGKTKLPMGEYRLVTQGIVSSHAALINFTILSDEIESSEYRRALAIVTNDLVSQGASRSPTKSK